MADKIKTLDELAKGDVVSLGSEYIVDAIGDVPEHEIEVSLQMLYHPGFPNSEMKYSQRTVKQSELSKIEIEKLDKKDYTNWKYLSIQRIS